MIEMLLTDFFIKTNYKWAEFDKNIQKSPTYNVKPGGI